MPLGSVGKICIAGSGVALGYHRNAELTQKSFTTAFIEDKRVYITGDLGRWNETGQLEFLGREDRQVKIRGHRIDCTEVDEVLQRHPLVLRAFTIPVGENEEKSLVAAIECINSELPSDKELSQHTRTSLPDAHIPNNYVFLDSFPLSVNGKLDRVALSGLAKQQLQSLSSEKLSTQESADDFNSSNLNSLKQELTKIWAQLLNCPQLNVHDNFFDVGGHSLLAVRLLRQMKNAISVEVTLAQLLRTPTVNSLALAIHRKNAVEVDNGMTKIRDGQGSTNLFLVPPAGHSLIYFAPLVEHLDSQCNVYSVDSSESTNWNTLEAYASFIVEHIVSIQPTGPWLIGGACFGNHIALEVCAQLPQQSASSTDLFLIDSRAPLNGPGWKYDHHFKLQQLKARRNNPLKFYFNSLQREYKNDRWKALGMRQQRRLRGIFNSNIRKYSDIQSIQSEQFEYYKARVVTANMTLILSRQFAQLNEEIERWRSLTLSTFCCHNLNAKSHYDLVNKRSSYWRQIAQLINESILELSLIHI